MSQYLKSYQVELRTVGPVFIGSGKEISKKEYIFLENKRIGILDIERLYFYLVKKRKEKEFEKYLLYDVRNDLTDWIKKQGIKRTEIKPFIKYMLDCGDSVVEQKSKLQVMECIKDAYGNPYVPGSSLKGMFRTVLLSADIIKNSQKYQREKSELREDVEISASRTSYLKQDIEAVEGKAFRTLNREETRPRDAVNDILQGVIFSDSNPLDVKQLALCQRIELHTDGTEKRLPLLRECIKPDMKICFTITIDRSMCKLTAKQLMQAVKLFGENYYQNFACAFRNADMLRDNEVLLGGGCGFVSKTIIYPMFGKKEGIRVTKNIFDKTKVPREHKHNKDEIYGASPHIMKCTCYQGRTMPMGICRIKRIVQE